MNDRILAKYRIETQYTPERAATVMAGEQSCGTFIRVHGETDELREQHSARIESIIELEPASEPSLPCSRYAGAEGDRAVFRRAEVTLSFPLQNVGVSLPNLMSTVAGNLYELHELSGIRLMDIEVPFAFAEAYSGPQFGIEGTRRLTDVWRRPIIGTIVKPSVGLSPEQTASLVSTLCEARLDFIKDDELMADPPHSPLRERVEAVMRVINQHAERTGKKVMYAFNITGEIDEMLRHHDTVFDAGGTCVMLSLNSVGLPAVAYLRRHSRLPIHGHRNGWGALSRHAYLGMDFRAYQKFWRLAGVDHLHVNGLRNKFCEPDDSVVASARACLTPMLGGYTYTVMPVFSSGQWAGQAPDTYSKVGSVDLMYLCGGGIMAHPDGVAEGVASVLEGWEAALAGKSIEEYAVGHPALKRAVEVYG